MVCAVHHLSRLERLLLGFFRCLLLLLLRGITLFIIVFFLFGLLRLLFLLLLLLFGWLGFGNVRIQIHGFANSLYTRMKDRAWSDHWDEAIGESMDLNPHIPKPEPPKEEEKKEEEKTEEPE
jgi:hypothetical protein